MNKRKKIVLGIIAISIVCLIFFLFNSNTYTDDTKSMNDRGGDSFTRWYKIKFKGDISAYKDAQIEALDDSYRGEAFLNYALIMADKYNYIPAYFDVYWCLYSKQELYNDTLYILDSLNESEREMAIKYLILAKNKGDFEAMEYLGQYYKQGKYFDKDTALGEKLINESYKRFGNK